MAFDDRNLRAAVTVTDPSHPDGVISSNNSSSSSAASLIPLAKLQQVAQSDPKLRFQLECEFVEMLATPTYLNYLAEQRYLENVQFVNYIKYLQYWRRPEYLVYISYPHALFFLDMLQHAPFRAKLIDPGFIRYLAENQHAHFRWWRYHRVIERIQADEEPLAEPLTHPTSDDDRSTNLNPLASNQIAWLLAEQEAPSVPSSNSDNKMA